MEDLDIIKQYINEYNTYITVTKENYKHKDIFKKFINQGLLLQSKPNLIITRKLKEILDNNNNI